MGRSFALAAVLVGALLAAAVFVYRALVDTPGERIVSAPPPPTDAGLRADPTADPTAVPTAAATLDAGPSEQVRAEILATRGAVQVRTGTGPWNPAQTGQRLGTEDAVRSGRNAEATLKMGSGVEVQLSPRSEFSIRELSDEVSRIRLEEGHVTASVDAKGQRVLKVAARGTDAEATSAGGSFGVVADGKGQLAIATTTGSVKLAAAGQTVEVAAGQTSTVSEPTAPPSAPRPIPASLFLKVAALGAAKTNQTQVFVTGQTEPGAVVKAGDYVAQVDAEGKFRVPVALKDGENKIAVEVVDATGRSRSQALPPIVVDRQKPQIEAETTWGQKP